MGFVSVNNVEMLVNVNANIFAAVITALEFAAPTTSEELDCRAAFNS